jgi:hypothetical protein
MIPTVGRFSHSTFENTFSHMMSAAGQSLLDCDVRVTSVHPSISDIMLQRRERRNGPMLSKKAK